MKIEIMNVVVFFGGSLTLLFVPGLSEWYIKVLAALCSFVAGMSLMDLLITKGEKEKQ